MKTEERKNNFLENTNEIILYENIKDNFFDSDGSWSLVKDKITGHIWLSPKPVDDELHKLYSNYYTHTSLDDTDNTIWKRAIKICLNRVYKHPLNFKPRIEDKLLSYMISVESAAKMEVAKIDSIQKGSLLDFGCGNGFFMEKMFRFGWDVVGIEFDSKAVEKNRMRYNHIFLDSLDDLHNLNKKFDVITLSHVIEHLSDPIDTLLKLKKFLSPTGRIILTTPNANSLGFKLFGKHWRGLETPRHLNIFTPKSAQCLAEKINMKASIGTETRLARDIFFTSALSFFGEKKIELQSYEKRKTLKALGYIFQIIESLILNIRKDIGEEIFIDLRVNNHD